MKILRTFLVFSVVVIITNCSSSINVMYDYDSEYDYTSLKTFKWILIEAPASISELRIKRFMNAINNELEAKGLELSTENPDFLIALHGMTQSKVSVNDWGYGPGPYRRWEIRDFDISTYEEGTILLDFVDGKSMELFWRGIGTRVAVEPNLSADEQIEKFSKIASDLLEEFPPIK
ncbi:MAG: DUF4136 domain-containing protein [Ignavibacteria bacterium]|nr:DUF4136 domain-containing protein [Ignavibacteria bacterium]